MTNSPYHIKEIIKGEYGKFSKIQEEMQELDDANQQENPILELCEIADMLGAIEAYTISKYNIKLADIYLMTKLNRAAFETGYRK